MRELRKMGKIANKTLDGNWEMVKTYIPMETKVCEFCATLACPD